MKKFIKKSIAGLIAGIMAISSMPFTALADTTALDNAKSALNNFGYTNPTGDYGSFADDKTSDFASGTGYTTYMRNVLYGEKNSSDDQGKTSSGTVQATIHYPQMVLLYDGQNDLDIPVTVSLLSSGQNRYTYAAVNNTTGLTYVNNSLWYGSDKNCNWAWLYSNSMSNDLGQLGSTTSSGKTVQISKTKFIGIGGWDNIWYSWANMFRFNGLFNANEYTKSITPTITFYTGSSTTVTTTDIVNTCKASKALYFVNYKAVLDTINTAKTDINTVSYDKYTDASVDAYANAVTALTSFNPTSLSFSAGSLESDVNTAGTTIKKLVDDYNTAKSNLEVKKYTFKFISSTGESVTCEAQDASTAYFWGVTSGNAPKTVASSKTYAGDNQHTWYEYSYPTEPTNYEFIEKGEQKFEACNYVDGVCTVCGHTSIDYSAFDAAVKAAEELTNEDEKYTADSFAAYKAKVAEIKAKRDTAANQAELDALITELANANDLLKAAAFTVKLVYVDEDGNEKTADTKTVKYGETYEAVSDKNVDKWTVETDNGQTTTKLNVFDKTVSVIITKDATIKAFQTEEATEVATSKVTFVGKNNVVVAIKYVQEGYEFNTSKVAVPAVPFYSSNGWDTESITGDGKEYTVRAVYTCTQSEDDMCNVHFGEWSKKYSYDSYVYLFNADKSLKYALYSDEACTQLLTILDGVDFYAPKTSNIYVKEYTETLADAVIGVTGTFVETTDSAKSAVYNCKFYLPENATAIEWGLEVTLNGKTVNVKAESKSSRNEYSVRLNAPTTFTGEISGRAYVTYKLGDQTITKYSSAVNQTL